MTALDAASGKAVAAMIARYRSEELPKFLNLIDTQAPVELPHTVELVVVGPLLLEAASARPRNPALGRT